MTVAGAVWSARLGLIRFGLASLGMAGEAGFGSAWHVQVGCGKSGLGWQARLGMSRLVRALHGAAGLAGLGALRLGIAWRGWVRLGSAGEASRGWAGCGQSWPGVAWHRVAGVA